MKHELARGGLQFPSGVVVARPDFLATHLEVAASGYRALIFTMILEIRIEHHAVTTVAVDRFRRVHCEIRRELILEELIWNGYIDRVIGWVGGGGGGEEKIVG